MWVLWVGGLDEQTVLGRMGAQPVEAAQPRQVSGGE